MYAKIDVAPSFDLVVKAFFRLLIVRQNNEDESYASCSAVIEELRNLGIILSSSFTNVKLLAQDHSVSGKLINMFVSIALLGLKGVSAAIGLQWRIARRRDTRSWGIRTFCLKAWSSRECSLKFKTAQTVLPAGATKGSRNSMPPRFHFPGPVFLGSMVLFRAYVTPGGGSLRPLMASIG